MISEDEVEKAIQALWNQENHYQTKQGKVLVFDDESLKVAQSYQKEGVKWLSITITITSYPSFRSDLEHYQKQSYDYLILDEAQMIKNSQTKTAQALREFDVKTCYALSGTPIENRLEEIWSIFQIVLPGLLPSKKEFSKLSPQLVAKLI
ncbi:snf2 family protein [Streptococcus pneumoniae]|nr:snf2 family protein [Streptococcus pneumoniae]